MMKNRIWIVFLVCVAAFTGAVFGFLGQLWYSSDFTPTKVHYPEWVGICLGTTLGAGTAWGYTAGLTSICKIINRKWLILVCGSLLGLVAGLVCSTVFHFILMTMHKTNHAFPMFIGAICSGPAGLLIGLVFSTVLVCGKKHEIQIMV